MANVTTVVNGRKYSWTFGTDGSLALDDKECQAEVLSAAAGCCTVSIGGKLFRGLISRNNLQYSVLINQKKYILDIEPSTKKSPGFGNNHAQKTHSQIEVRSPMPGMVVRCEVKEGMKISLGDGLLILEAMKMENEIRAAHGGIVKKVLVTDRQVVDKGALLLIIE